MTEPTTTTALAIAATGFSVAALLPGMDGNAIIGAFAGAALVAMHVRDVRAMVRATYLGISWIMGYLAAPIVVRTTGLHETGVAAFVAAATVIALTLQLLDRVKTLNLADLLRRSGGDP